mgnify:CR=1 FL=1
MRPAAAHAHSMTSRFLDESSSRSEATPSARSCAEADTRRSRPARDRSFRPSSASPHGRRRRAHHASCRTGFTWGNHRVGHAQGRSILMGLCGARTASCRRGSRLDARVDRRGVREPRRGRLAGSRGVRVVHRGRWTAAARTGGHRPGRPARVWRWSRPTRAGRNRGGERARVIRLSAEAMLEASLSCEPPSPLSRGAVLRESREADGGS